MESPSQEPSFASVAFPHVRRWVVVGAGLIAAGYLVSITVRLLTANSTWIITEYAALAAAVTGLLFAIRGRVRLAAVFLTAVVWLEVHMSIFLDGGFVGGAGGGAALPVLPALVVGTGLFLGGWAAIGLAIATVISVPVVAAAGAAVLHAGGSAGGLDLYRVVILDLTMLASGFLVHQGVRSFRAVAQAGATHERKFALLHQHAPYGVVLLDEAGRIESLNPAAATLLGVGEADVRGRFLPTVLAPLTGQPEALIPLPDAASPLPAEVSLSHGQTRRLVEIAGSRTVLGNGSPGIQVLLRDVTGRREVERHAIELGRMLDRAPSEAYVFDADSLRLRFVNLGARRNLGYASGEIEALTITDVAPDLTRAEVRRLMTELSARPDETLPLAGRHRRKNGSTYPVDARLHLVAFAGESAVGLFALDITARVAAAAEHERLRTRMLDAQRFEVVRHIAGAIAHEFNNLLMSVGGYAEMIAQFAGEERVREWAGRIRGSQQRGAALIRRFQGLARADVARPEPVSLSEALGEFLPVLERTLGPAIRVRLTPADRDVVLIDRSQLEQVVLHLATNARDAMPAGGTVEVVVRGAAPEEPDVVLEVRDSGTGMSAETLARAFDPFFTTKPGAAGTGLGLTAVHGIVTHAGGRVGLESAVGRGTVARLQLPAAPPGRRPRRVTTEGAPTAAPSAPGNILVVEDDRDTRDVVSLALAGAGHAVRAVGTAEEALAWLEERQGDVDLVLTDVALPAMNGFTLGAEVESRFAPTRVLYMSGHVRDHEAGAPPDFDPATMLLLKPFATDELLARVRAALGREARGGNDRRGKGTVEDGTRR
jgi:hypothetical protein